MSRSSVCRLALSLLLESTLDIRTAPKLAFVYDKRSGSPFTAGRDDGCVQLTVAEGAAQLAVVPVGRSGFSAPVRPAPTDPAAAWTAVAATSDGYAAVEACGAKNLFLFGPVRLVRYDKALQIVSRERIGPCQNSARGWRVP